MMTQLAFNISGIGTDIVSLQRIRRILARYPKRFPQRILHANELESYALKRDRVGFLARRFAAKEAVAKALGLGFTRAAYARNICIQPNQHGAPQVQLKNSCAALFPTIKILLSISDEIEYAIAYAIALVKGGDTHEPSLSDN